MRVCVIGVGLIGGSIALAARGRLGATVAGWDADTAALADAVDSGLLDEALGAPQTIGDADVVFCATPIAQLPEVVTTVLAAAGPETVVTDVGSVKQPLASITDPRFVGGHPLAGGEASGATSARADLFDGATWYLTPGPHTSGIKYERLHRFLASLGARPAAIDADEHDRLMAVVSHLPHVFANVLVERATAGGGTPPPIGPSFRDATRVAGANPELWAGIYAANAPALTAEIDAAIARLTTVRDEIAALEGWQRDAQGRRDVLLGTDQAGGETAEIGVTVPNEPGVVADIALALGRARINIADMSLAPSADQATGLIRLYVPAADLDRARELIAQKGLTVS